MEAAPAIPAPIQAILNKPGISRNGDEKSQLQKHFEQGVQTLAEAEVAEGGVYAIALSPNGDRVAAAGGDGTVRLFDTQSGSVLTSFVPVEIKSGRGGDAGAGERDAYPHPLLPPSPHLSLERTAAAAR